MLHIQAVQHQPGADLFRQHILSHQDLMIFSPVPCQDMGTGMILLHRALVPGIAPFRGVASDPRLDGQFRPFRCRQRFHRGHLIDMGIPHPVRPEGFQPELVPVHPFLRDPHCQFNAGKSVALFHHWPMVTKTTADPFSWKLADMICLTSPAFMPPSMRHR